MIKAKIYYIHPCDIRATRDEKMAYLQEHKFQDIPFDHIVPDNKSNWINQSDNDFNDLLVLIDEDVKSGNSKQAIFKLYTIGVNTNRDGWVYDFGKNNLIQKMIFFIKYYNTLIDYNDSTYPTTIKWSSSLKNYFIRKIKAQFDEKYIILSLFRPFILKHHYTEKILNHRLTKNHYEIYGKDLKKDNIVIAISGMSSNKYYQVLSSRNIIGLDTLEKTQCLPLYRYDTNGNRYENITDWGLEQFHENYKDNKITKEDIFHYVYGILHNPEYRKKYELNLKREFPRIPFYNDFWKWSQWGKELMDLHINFEQAEKYPLQIVGSGFDKARTPNAKLRADKENGIIILDEQTSLTGIPKEAWQYKLGNRSALEWILDQYKEKKPKDPTIREKFNTYKFADYKEKVINLLMRVTTVSIKTMKIVNSMNSE